ncbi:MAG: hypothetical protein ACFFC7_11875 [Candidatus Hermodarchaeota archaeon]
MSSENRNAFALGTFRMIIRRIFATIVTIGYPILLGLPLTMEWGLQSIFYGSLTVGLIFLAFNSVRKRNLINKNSWIVKYNASKYNKQKPKMPY